MVYQFQEQSTWILPRDRLQTLREIWTKAVAELRKAFASPHYLLCPHDRHFRVKESYVTQEALQSLPLMDTSLQTRLLRSTGQLLLQHHLYSHRFTIPLEYSLLNCKPTSSIGNRPEESDRTSTYDRIEVLKHATARQSLLASSYSAAPTDPVCGLYDSFMSLAVHNTS
jgi:hypothetical protein